MTLLHATGIYFAGKGVLIKGPSGAGKSDLALRLMGLGADLISDDYVEISKNTEGLVIMRSPENISGLIEVHNVGLLKVPCLCEAQVDLILELVGLNDIGNLERLPERKMSDLEGVKIPCLDFFAFEASAPEKLRAALNIFCQKS